MEQVGPKIREARKMKGLSQEELAESAGLSLRTIQRIENDQSEPRGKTLQLICEVLDINVEDILDYGKQKDSTYLMFFHLSVLSFFLIPLGNIILPLILWLTKKDKIVALDEIGKNTLNFQIIWSVFAYVSFFTFVLYKIQNWENLYFLLYTYYGLCIINIILAVFFAISSKTGHHQRRYPALIQLIK